MNLKNIATFFQKHIVILFIAFLVLIAAFAHVIETPENAGRIPITNAPNSKEIPVRYIIYGICGVMILLISTAGFVTRGLVKSDIEDIKQGRIWTPLGYKNISGSYEDNLIKYRNQEFKRSDLS